MIGLLRGNLLVKKPPNLMVDVGGVGYELQAPMSTFYKLPAVGSGVTLFTQFIIRENSQALYGFCTEYERGIFREIIKISGVGPKLAITILSGMEIAELLRCIRERDVDRLVRMPGVGKKTAERLLVELQDKLANYLVSDAEPKFSDIALTTNSDQANAMQDAISALVALGYKEPEAKRALAKVSTQATDSESLIRFALQNMGR